MHTGNHFSYFPSRWNFKLELLYCFLFCYCSRKRLGKHLFSCQSMSDTGKTVTYFIITACHNGILLLKRTKWKCKLNVLRFYTAGRYFILFWINFKHNAHLNKNLNVKKLSILKLPDIITGFRQVL